MNVLRLVLALVCCSLPALAQGDCEDSFLECKDDCLIEFGGSVRVEMKKRYDKCMKRCTKKGNQCTERVMETKASGLEEGALDGAPTSDEVDSSGLPTRTGSEPKKKKKARDDVREDDAVADDEPVKKKEKLSESEVPKSDRTKLKVDEPKEPARVEAPPPKKEEPPARKLDEDLRDDGARVTAPARKEEVEEAAPPPKKKEEKKEPPKKKEEDHDDLRFY